MVVVVVLLLLLLQFWRDRKLPTGRLSTAPWRSWHHMALQPTTSQGAMNEIRAAYSAGNVEASKQAHTAARAEADIHSGAKSEYVKSMIFGGLDGIITTFAIVAAGAGAELEAGLVIVLGCANLISDGMSMGLGDYFSEKSEEECEDAKRETVLRVVSRMPAESIKVLRDHYVTKKGFLPSDADTMLNRYIKYKGMFADLVVAEQSARLNHQFKLLKDRIAEPAGGAADGGEEEEEQEEEEEDGEKIWKQGLLTTLSFWTFGSIPVIAYAIASGLGATKTTTFVVDIIVTIMALAALGVAQATMSGEARAKKALQMIVNGALACSVGYLIAWFVASFIVDEGALCGGATCRPPFMDQWRFDDAPWLSWETAVPAPDGSDSVNWHCSAHSWNDVTFRNDADHIIHTRVDLFAGENGLYEVAGKAGHSPELTMTVGETYFFDQTHHTNWMHPLGFAYYADGHHGKTWGSAPRATITDFDALEYRINNVAAKRIESRDIMEYHTQAYDSSFSHLKEDWLHKMHGVQLTITEEIANEAAQHGGVIYYYSRFHARTSGKIRIVGEVDGGAYAPTSAELFESAVATGAFPYNP